MDAKPKHEPPAPQAAHAYGELRYPDYLRVGELLALQQPLTSHHDEMLFIVAHQIFELGFKLLIHEFEEARRALDADEVRLALKASERARVGMGIFVHQVDLLETMSALDFLAFRDSLEGASGFQSAQFRELELLLGLSDEGRVAVKLEGRSERGSAYYALLDPAERARVERRKSEPTLDQSFLALVARAVRPDDVLSYAADDVVDLAETLATERAEALRALVAGARRAPEAERRRATDELWALAPSLGLAGADRSELDTAVASARLLDWLRQRGTLGGAAGASPSAHRARSLAEVLDRSAVVPRAAVDSFLAGAGGEALLRLLDQRAKLRQVYRQANHVPGGGDTYEIFLLAESLLGFSQTFSLFRFRHVLMVERMIGFRRGTGGSPGASYLEKTVAYRFFPELWRIRTHI